MHINSIEKQIDIFIYAGFHEVLRMSEEAYRSYFDHLNFKRPPGDWFGYRPVSVDSRISDLEMCDRFGLPELFDSIKFSKNRQSVSRPNRPYATRMHPGSFWYKYTPQEIWERAVGISQASTTKEVACYYMFHREDLGRQRPFCNRLVAAGSECLDGSLSPFIDTDKGTFFGLPSYALTGGIARTIIIPEDINWKRPRPLLAA